MQVFVVNLAHHQERRESIDRLLKPLGLGHEIFPAVYGKLLSAEEKQRDYNEARTRAWHDRPLTDGEVGCALSHLGVYRLILERNLPLALILEDDARPGPDLPRVLEAVTAEVSPDEPRALLLTHVPQYVRRGKRALFDRYCLARPYQPFLTHGYVVTRAAAQLLAETLYPVWHMADCWHFLQNHTRLQVEALIPCCIGLTELARHSDIGIERDTVTTTHHRGLRNYLRSIYYERIFPLIRRLKGIECQQEPCF